MSVISDTVAQLALDPYFLKKIARVVTVLPKVIDLDWESDDPSKDNVLPNPNEKGLYKGDYVVWRNHTTKNVTIQFTGRVWPFSGPGADIPVPAGCDSDAFLVVTQGAAGPQKWGYAILENPGPPSGPGVVVPSG